MMFLPLACARDGAGTLAICMEFEIGRPPRALNAAVELTGLRHDLLTSSGLRRSIIKGGRQFRTKEAILASCACWTKRQSRFPVTTETACSIRWESECCS